MMKTTQTDRYNDKMVRVSGMIKSIQQNNSIQTIFLSTSSALCSIICHFDGKHKEQLNQLKPWQPVVVKGVCAGILKHVVLEKCELEREVICSSNRFMLLARSNFYGRSGLVECSVSSPAHKGGTFLKNIKQISMKTLLVILFAGTFAIFISSCNNTSARETGAEQEAAPIKEITNDNVISYKVNGELVKTSGWNISRFQLTNDSKESLNLTTNMHEEKRTININISGQSRGNIVIKTDDKSGHNFYGSYFPDYINDLVTVIRLKPVLL